MPLHSRTTPLHCCLCPPLHEDAFLRASPPSLPSSYVHNTATRAFSIIAPALGIPHSYLSSKLYVAVKSHGRQDTDIWIVQQIAIMMGCAVLPHLHNLVACIAHGLHDEQQKVWTMTALVPLLKQLPPMIESFDEVLKPLWLGIHLHCGKGLAAFLKVLLHGGGQQDDLHWSSFVVSTVAIYSIQLLIAEITIMLIFLHCTLL
ncbi:hypothetical protein M405DRAFT_929050 [Rhizopogon salebrosus TDB-379]|nr:hypothetical protein M405DRAFT_929050 [Rhizopogon salebrosus TDB-379]